MFDATPSNSLIKIKKETNRYKPKSDSRDISGQRELNPFWQREKQKGFG